MEASSEQPVVEGQPTYSSITEKISALALTERTPLAWFVGFGLAFSLLMLLLLSIGYLLVQGVGIWGLNVPVAWGFAIVNFVWWIGIGHAGTLISAILLLFRQEWRTSINRFAEAMTLFAVACAGLFPLIHLGRPGLFYWLLPYPNTMGLWPQFRSPLVWDVFAVLTYATVSLLFWYVGLIPDLATLRDRADRLWVKRIYGFFAMGWRNSAVHWQRYQSSYFLIAALATPLVISVHSIVGLDFAISVLPGWHTTISPPFFVAGAVFSGFAMVLVLSIPLRRFYDLDEFITLRHLDNMAKIMLATGLMVAYGYLMEIFTGWYSGNTFEQFLVRNRFLGPYAILYWVMLGANVLAPQVLWFRRLRRNSLLLFVVALVVLIGMWLERFIIVAVSLHRDFLPSSWGMYVPTVWDWATFVGTIGLFLTLIFLFIRFVPVISIFEMRELVSEKGEA
ncbi:MAG: NrfD/PsrC family molybdoenzyme membrane anchor subunit [Candidatus Promineifilaceae bacterium]|nr:NrfD/PsrC family molybdoenzyme membrane anchor subunit [Candidatus Promineifilaceae bacterium]